MSTTVAPSDRLPVAQPSETRPLRSRYWLVALLPLVALVSILMWGFTVHGDAGAEAKSFVRGTVPGTATVAGHPGTWFVYAEGSTTITGVTVHDQSGEFPVTMLEPSGAPYDHGGRTATRVARFDVAPGRIGQWQVTVTGSSADPGSGFAVGEFDAIGYTNTQRWGMAALLVVNVGASIAIAVVPVLRWRRRRSERPV